VDNYAEDLGKVNNGPSYYVDLPYFDLIYYGLGYNVYNDDVSRGFCHGIICSRYYGFARDYDLL